MMKPKPGECQDAGVPQASGSPYLMPGANPSWQGPWESALMETSEREKLMGTLCQGNEENKKPATEMRTSRRPPSTAPPQALWQPAHLQGSAGQGSPPRGSRRHRSAVPGPVLVEEAEVGKKNAGRCGDVQVPVPNPKSDGCAGSTLHSPPASGTTSAQLQHGQPNSWGVIAFRTQEEESRPHGCSTTATKGHIYIRFANPWAIVKACAGP